MLATEVPKAVVAAAATMDVPDSNSSSTEETFLRAEHLVTVVLSRLEKDPLSVPPPLWGFWQQPTANRLWALKQQALSGSCEASRGFKQYAAPQTVFPATRGLRHCLSFPCCQFIAGDSKLKLWQELGDMPADEAQREYVKLVAEVLPSWESPPSWDEAMLRTWTPDDCSDRCAVCEELFTLLNRRHHCRRCLNLVCAVCSPNTLPLRVLAQPTTTRQRVCVTCFTELSGNAPPTCSSITTDTTTNSNVDQVREPTTTITEATPPATVHGEGSAVSDASSLCSTTEEVVAAKAEGINDPEPTSLPVQPTVNAAIHSGTLQFLQEASGSTSPGAKARGFRKAWRPFFFVLLVRKGSLGMFASQVAHSAGTEPPQAVFKLSGYTLRVRSQSKRPHQFRLTHSGSKLSRVPSSPKKPLQFSARSLEDMNAWIGAIVKAIAFADELERPMGDDDRDVDEVVLKMPLRLPGGERQEESAAHSEQEHEAEQEVEHESEEV